MILTVQGALPLMPDGSSIILTSSIVASKGIGGNSVYAATKAVARSFARNWTTDLKARHIRVNAISPGMTDTEGLRGLLGSSEAGIKRREQSSSLIPMGRMGKPEEVADAAVFLASAESSYITGSELFVDGGIAQV